MRYQDLMIETTKNAADEAFRYAATVPEDKVEWKPLESGRSVLDQARELAKCPSWAHLLVSGQDFPAQTEESAAASKAEMEAMKTIAECRETCLKNLEELFELYRTLPDERLTDTKWLPFDGGRDFTVKEMMAYPQWNFIWHAGQIAYVQTLYGDKAMH